jgi:chemotaxis protein CheD
MERIFVKSGEVHCSEIPTIFKTVLGSCVSVCLWDEQLHIGGLNHFILPSGRNHEVDARFGNIAIPQLIRRLEVLGCASLVAKVFGGAAVMSTRSIACVGEVNTELAMALLRERRIPVIAQRTGGDQGIVIQYWSGNGEVLVREIARA